MITEDYISFEIAKLLKEKGFKEWCRKSYGMDVRYKGRTIDFDEECELKDEGYGDELEYIDGGRLYHSGWDNSDEDGKIYAAPTLWVTMKWLREVHNIYLDIRITNHGMSNMVDIIKYYWVAISTEDAKWMAESTVRNVDCFKTYNEAIEDGIKYCLENLI